MKNNSPNNLFQPSVIHPFNDQSGEAFCWALQFKNSLIVTESSFPLHQSHYQRTEKMARLEAALFVAKNALSPRKLLQLATIANVNEVRQLVEQLNIAYDETKSAFRIERVAAGYQMLTRPDYSKWLNKLHQRSSELKLSPPALETMTIVAYRQPITRADIEAVRGVHCTEMLKQLMERGLINICGEDDSLGRPYLYGTTSKFLEHYGLCSLKELPMSEKLRPQKKTIVAEELESTEDEIEEAEDEDDDINDENESYEESA